MRAAVVLSLLLLARPQPVAAQDQMSSTSPLAHRTTRVLANGLRVHIVTTSEATSAAMLVVVPVGSRQDPVALQTLAHFTEHLQFADNHDKTTRKIKSDIESLGGHANAATYGDRTVYYVRIGAQQRDSAIRWLAGILEPKVLTPALVDRERLPVIVEEALSPLTPLEWAWATLLYPARWRRPDEWTRGFGMTPDPRDVTDRFASNARIGVAELDAFYREHYAPGGMSLIVVSNGAPDSVLATVAATFGRLVPRTVPAPVAQRTPIADGRTRWYWDTGAMSVIRARYALPPRTPDEDARAAFVARFLAVRLNDTLRFGRDKSVYGVRVELNRMQGGAVLSIGSTADAQRVNDVRRAIDREVAALRDGSMSDSTWEQTKRRLVEGMTTTLRDPVQLALWYGNPDGDDAPAQPELTDVLARMRAMSRAEIASYAHNSLREEWRATSITQPSPVPLWVQIPALLLIAVGAWWWTRRRAPLPMRELRYSTRIRLGWAQRLMRCVVTPLTIIVVAYAIGGELNARLRDQFHAISTFALSAAFIVAAVVAAIRLLIAVRARTPDRLLVFTSGIAIFAGRRTIWVPTQNVEAATATTWRDIAGTSHSAIRFASKGHTPALFLRLTHGPSWMLGVRDASEAAEVVAHSIGLDDRPKSSA